MGVGNQNGSNFCIRCGRKNSLNMWPVDRAGVEHDHIPFPDQIGAGAGEGEGPAIVANNTPHQRRKLDNLARLL